MPIVTLVHGTWSQHASWCAGDSKLCRSLAATLGEETHVERFVWSGRNSHRARIHGAKMLRQHIAETKNRFPDQKHFLISHSHGGAVCLYALRDHDADAAVSGVVTMSTPFIVCRRRNLGISPMIPVLIFALATIGLGSMAMLINRVSDDLLQIVTEAILFALLLITLVVDVLIRQRFFGGRSHQEIYDRAYASFALKPIEADRLFIVRTVGDEASGALAVAHIASWLLSFLSQTVSRLYALAKSIGDTHKRTSMWRRVVFGSVSLLCGLGSFWSIGTIYHGNQMGWIIAGGAALVFMGMGYLLPSGNSLFGAIGSVPATLASAILIPILIFLAVLAAPFGIDTLLLASMFDFSVESSPPGQYSVTTAIAAAGTLLHSAAYEDENILAAIGAWINGRLAYLAAHAEALPLSNAASCAASPEATECAALNEHPNVPAADERSGPAELVITTSRKAPLILLGILPAVIVGFIFMRADHPVLSWFFIIFLSLVTLLFVPLAVMPKKSYLRLDAEGFEMHSPLGRRKFNWLEVEELCLCMPGKMVGIMYRNAHRKQWIARGLNLSLYGAHDILGSSFSVPSIEVVNTLNAWRKKFGVPINREVAGR